VTLSGLLFLDHLGRESAASQNPETFVGRENVHSPFRRSMLAIEKVGFTGNSDGGNPNGK
jgi:hypothetical protein